MNLKKPVISLLLSTFLLSLAFGFVANAETQLVWSSPDEWEGIDVEIYAPHQTYPGDNITIRVKVGATKNLNDTYLTVRIYGSKSEGNDSWTTYVYILSGEDLPIGAVLDQNFTLNIISDVSPGSIYGHIYCLWNVVFPVPKGYSQEDSFEVTYSKSKEFEELKAQFEELNASYYELNGTYNSLLANYTKLKNYKSELGSTRNLMYVFVATTVVSAATVFILLIKKPKRVWT